MNPFDDEGKELLAAFAIKKHQDGFDLIVESQGGFGRVSSLVRNKDYSLALNSHFKRMRAAGMVIADIQLASRPALLKSEADRRLSLPDFPFPLEMHNLENVDDLRKAIARVSGQWGAQQRRRAGANKRLLLRVLWPNAEAMSAGEIEALLAHGADTAQFSEMLTSDPDELGVRVRQASMKIRQRKVEGVPVSVPDGQQHVERSSATVSRFLRDPNVVAWVLDQAKGVCELCKQPAPFRQEDGEPYLEVHHILPLAEGGPDTIDNAAACCPNCHRLLHYGAERHERRRELINTVERLADYIE